MSAAPRVSVVVPVFNGASTLAGTLGSVFAQTFTDFEVIVVDDGSTDATPHILRDIGDPRLRVLSFANGGPSASRNRGIGEARGEYIAFLDADDQWTPDKLALQVAALDANPRAGLVYSWTDCFDEGGGFLRHGSHVRLEGPGYEALVARNVLDNGSSPMVRRSVLAAVGGFDESLRNAEDWELWLRIARHHELACVPRVQVFYRVRPQSGASATERQAASTLAVLERALQRIPEASRREELRRTVTANLYKYLAVRLAETSSSRADGRLAARYWGQFVRTTPTPLADAGKALVIAVAIAVIVVLPPALVARLRRRIAALRGRAGLRCQC